MNAIISLKTSEIFGLIEDGVKSGKDFSYFLPYYQALSQRTLFIGSTLENEWFYRGRIASNRLFTHIDELKYPPKEFARKGRLNDNGEQMAYLSLSEIAPLVELDINYYQLYCMIKIKHIIKDTIFYYVGVKGEYKTESPADIEINNFYMQLLSGRESECYNATIALGKHFMGSNTLIPTGGKCKTGIVYNSVHEDKSNKLLYNIAVLSCVFNECFVIEEASYQILAYDSQNDAIIMHDINKGAIQTDGSIYWTKTYPEMIDELKQKFSKRYAAEFTSFLYGRG